MMRKGIMFNSKTKILSVGSLVILAFLVLFLTSVKASTVIEVQEFANSPNRLTPTWLYTGGSYTKDIRANQNLKLCEVQAGVLQEDSSCVLSGTSTVRFTKTLSNFTSFSTVIVGSLRLVSNEGEVSYVPVKITVYNTLYKVIGIPLFVLLLLILVIGTIIFVVRMRKKKSKVLKKIKGLFI